jgi:hypothetical protein
MMVPRFSAICVSAGKSASAILIHCALQPVAISEIDNTIARIVLDFEIELEFIVQLLLGLFDTGCAFLTFAGSRATIECNRQPATNS